MKKLLRKKKNKTISSSRKKIKKTNTSRSKSKKQNISKVVISEVPIVVDKKSSNVEKKKKKEKKSSGMYFTQATQDAIIKYNAEENDEIRNSLYNTIIRPSFEKLVENIFNTFKFTYFETSPAEIQKETVAHLVSNMNKYQPEKGKAFGYFSIVAKHYLIFHNNNNYKRFKQNVDISDTPSESTVCLQTEDSYYKNEEMSEFMKLMIEYWEKNLNKIFTKSKDLNIANAVLELFRNGERIDSFNKKALYLYIREISACKTQQITKVINKMKQYQANITKCYLSHGVLQNNFKA